MSALIPYIPIATTVFAAAFTVVLFRHWRSTGTRYLWWWMVGVAMYGVGTLAESLNTVLGWHVLIFKSWYIAGALLGGWPLAQGTAYLLFRKRTADWLTWAFGAYIAVAALFGATSAWGWLSSVALITGAALPATLGWLRASRAPSPIPCWLLS